jgi:hypothetical protein
MTSGRQQVMIQKLSVVSVLVLVMLAGVGSVVVATHAFGGRAPNSIGGAPVLLSPVGAANADTGTNVGSASETTIHATSTVTVTSTVSAASSTSDSTSVSTTAQNSTSSSGGSLLVSGASGSNSTSHGDSGGDDNGAGGSGSGGVGDD